MRAGHYLPAAAVPSKAPADGAGDAVVRAGVGEKALGFGLGQEVAHVEAQAVPLVRQAHIPVGVASVDDLRVQARSGEEVVAGTTGDEEPVCDEPLTRGLREISRVT